MSAGDRGVSDVLAFVLIFAVMVTSVGIIAIAGFDTIGGVSDHDQLTSAEVSLTELADQLTGIADHEAPVRSSELRLRDGTVSVVDGPRMTVIITASDGPVWNDTFYLGGVEYALDERTVTVVGGAVVRVDGDHGVLVRDPPFTVVDDRVRLNLIRLDALQGAEPVRSDTAVQVRSHHDRSRLLVPDNRSALTDVTEIRLSFEDDGPLVDAWATYLDRNEAWTYEDGAWVLTELEHGAIVRLTRIDLQFIR